MAKQQRRKLIDLIRHQYSHLSSEEILIKILSGQTYINGEKVLDKNALVPKEGVVSFQSPRGYVSRGGEKLEPVLKAWDLPVTGNIFLDAGCSTGGFTQCLLLHGASLVYSVDVGYNQFDFTLKQDPRIRLYERTNIKELIPGFFDPPPFGAVCDLSFRSVSGIAGKILDCVTGDFLVALIKPQFELNEMIEEFDGVIKDPELLKSILTGVVTRLSEEGVHVHNVFPSPITGRKGNREFFFLLKKSEPDDPDQVLASLLNLV